MGKTGRNDPCRCGSNKKYKKCCMQKDVEKQKSLATNECAICSQKMDIEEIDRTVTRESAIGNFKLRVTVPICSDECSLAFDLKQLFIENQDFDVEGVINHFSISNDLTNKDIKIAINTLIDNGEEPLRRDLIEYLEYAKLHHLLDD